MFFRSIAGGPLKANENAPRPAVLLGLESECCLVFARSKSNERFRGGPFGLGGANRAPGESAPGTRGNEDADPEPECECELVLRI